MFYQSIFCETSELCSINQSTLDVSELFSINQSSLEISKMCLIICYLYHVSEELKCRLTLWKGISCLWHLFQISWSVPNSQYIYSLGRGAMRPWALQYSVRVVSRILFQAHETLFDPLGILFEPRQRLFKNNLLMIIDSRKKKIQKCKRAGIGYILFLALR